MSWRAMQTIACRRASAWRATGYERAVISGLVATHSATRARPTTAYPLPTRVSRALDHRQTLRAMTVPDQQLRVTVPPDTSGTRNANQCDLCAANYRVSSSNTCVACPGSSTNVAGDDSTGSATACDCPTGYQWNTRSREPVLRVQCRQLRRILFQHVCRVPWIVDKRCGR